MFIGSAIAANAYPPHALPILAARSSDGGGDGLVALNSPISIISQPKMETAVFSSIQGPEYQQYTIDSWFKVPTGGFNSAGQYEIISIEPFSLERSRVTVKNNNSMEIVFGNFNMGPTTETYTGSVTPFVPDTWHHIAWTFESHGIQGETDASNYLRGCTSKLYLDGVLVVTATNTIKFDLTISSVLNGSTMKMKTGQNREVYHTLSLYPELLPEEDVIALYNGGVPVDLREHPLYTEDFLYYLFGDGYSSDGSILDGDGWTGVSPFFAFNMYNVGNGALDNQKITQSTLNNQTTTDAP